MPTVAGVGNADPITMDSQRSETPPASVTKAKDGTLNQAPTSGSHVVVQRQVAQATIVTENGDAKQANESLRPTPAATATTLELFIEKSKKEDSSSHGSLGRSSSTLIGANIPLDTSDS